MKAGAKEYFFPRTIRIVGAPTSFLLAFLMVVTPVLQVYAMDETFVAPVEEVDATSSGSSDNSDDETDSGRAIKLESPKTSETGGEESNNPPMSLLSGDEDPIPYTTDRGGANHKPSLTPDENTGALRYSFPIITPPGRKGMEPNLELTYDSSSGKNEYFGLGWSINIPYIERINRTGVENLYTSRYFFSSLDGELREAATSSSEEMMMRSGGGQEESMMSLQFDEDSRPVNERIQGKSQEEKIAIKSVEIVKQVPTGMYSDEEKGLTFEIQSIEKIEGGVQVFARAWKDANPLGFGPDGSVEIERFRIFNPAILVPDENGSIERTWVDLEDVEHVLKYREDLTEAVRQELAHTISLVGKQGTKITLGKIGRTTDTYYPSLDGYAWRDNNGSPYQTWSALRSGAGTASGYTGTAYPSPIIGRGTSNSTWYRLGRSFFLFDTSAINDTDSVGSATFSFTSSSKANNALVSSSGIDLVLSSSTPASNSAIADSDYSQVGRTSFGTIFYASTTANSSTYNQINLNASGLAEINKTGVTRFGVRAFADLSDSVPSGMGGEGAASEIYMIMSEQSGTTADPKLVIEHTGTQEDFGARVENGDFRKYRYADFEWWEMKDKLGNTYKFGEATTTRQSKEGYATTTNKWMLEEVRDLNDNYVSYEYYKDSGQIYPSKITYTGSGSTDGIFEVDFLRTLNPDIATTTSIGFPVKTKYKITTINVKMHGNVVRSYALSYTNGYKDINTLLTSITESGIDELGATTTLPAYTFEYNQGFSPAWTLDTDFGTTSLENFISAPACSGDGVWHDTATRPVDVNGDGYADQISGRDVNLNSTIKSWFGHASGWNTGDDFIVGAHDDNGLRVIDVDGDGRPDLIRSAYGTGGAHDIQTYMHGGTTAWSGTSNYDHVDPIFTEGVQFGDVNGDGLTDMLQGYGTTYHRVFINRGDLTGWSLDSNYVLPIEFSDAGRQVADVNKDGLDDLVIAAATSSAQTKVYINKGDGTGWEYDSRYTIPVNFVENGADMGVRVADVTNDGYPDLVQSRKDATYPSGLRKVYVNNGDGTGWSDYGSVTIPVDFAKDGGDFGTRLMDVTGDGVLDMVQGVCDAGGGHSLRAIYSNNGGYSDTINYPDALTNITSATGEGVEVKYQTSPLYKNGSGALLNPFMFLVTNTVHNIIRDDGLGTLATTTYDYYGGKYYFADSHDRKFAGFATTTATDPAGNVTATYFHQGNGTLSAIGQYSDDFSKIGKPYRIEKYGSTGALYKKTINKWESVPLDYGRNFVKQTLSVDFTYDGDASHRDTGTTYAYDDENGNLLESVEYGEGTGSDNGNFSDTGSDKRTTTITYAASTTLHLLGLPSRELVVNSASTTIKDTYHYYDGLASGSVATGDETKTEFWKSASSYASTTKTYNAYGLLASQTDGRGNTTNYTYDGFNLYVGTSTNPLSQATQFYYDYTLGKPKSTIDANGREFQTVYDGLDRKLTEKQPDITTPSSLVTKKTYAYTDTQGSRKVLETNYLDGSTDFTTYTYLDGMDRTIQTRKEAEATSMFSVRDMTYNNIGLVARESLPYFSSGSSRTSATTTSALFTTYAYDALGRVSTLATAVGTTSNSYDDWRTVATDPNGKPKKFEKDAFGRLATVVEKNSSTYATTTYAWNANDTLATTTDSDGNVRHFTYDGRGLRLTAEDLHDAADGTYGIWTYTYDNAGNPSSYVDPKSQTVNFTYDALNRVLTEDYTGLAGTEVQYAYDSCTEGVSRLCFATSTGAVNAYTYNALGLAATTTTTIDNKSYATAYRYDRQGNQTRMIYPDYSEVLYAYNTAGMLESVQQKEAGGSFANIVTNFDYGPTGQVTYKLFGNNVESTYTYDPAKVYRLTNIYTIASSSGESLMGGGGMGFMADPLSPYALGKISHPLALESFEMPAEEPAVEQSPTPEETASPAVKDETKAASAVIEEKPIEPAPSPIRDQLKGMTREEAATFKGAAIAELGPQKPTERSEYTIEIVNIEAIDQGVQAFARVWDKNGGQIGFGKDGSVDIERFRIFNPPILVPDENGSIERVWVDLDNVEHVLRYREDLKESLLQVLEHTISVATKFDSSTIIADKVGNTTDTYYPSLDGYAWRDNNGSPYQTWSALRSGAGTASSYTNTSDPTPIIGRGTSDSSWFRLGRGFFLFDTSAIADTDIVGSATFSFTSSSKANNALTSSSNIDIVLSSSTPASNSALATSDYSQVGVTSYGTVSYSSITANSSTYNDISLSATGLTEISKTGVSRFGIRAYADLSDTAPAGTGGEGSASQVYILMSEQSGTTVDPKLVVEHHANSAPYAPISLLAEGATNPTGITDPTPEFSAIYKDPDTSDTATAYRVQVSTSSTFTSTSWDSGTTTMATTSQGSRSPDITYAGSALTPATTYYWRIAFSDSGLATGLWSTTTATFTYTPPACAGAVAIQDISYTYDANGNIITLTDCSATAAQKTVFYAYDDLNRLLTASTTAATSTAYSHTYAYDMLGRLTSMATGTTATYTYAETGYANPHAPTSVGGLSYTYDQSGNVTAIGSLDYTWDYRNRIASAEKLAGGFTTFGYDHQNQRTFKAAGTATTSYPSRFYTFASTTLTATTTKSVYAPDGTLLATIQGSGTSTATTTYDHADHLGGTNVVTNPNQSISQTLDYYPYGSERISSGTNATDRHYIGERFDEDSGLNYLNARYYRNTSGQFLSMDPVFLSASQNLNDPQSMNSYSYANGNPVVGKDPSGNAVFNFQAVMSAIRALIASFNVTAPSASGSSGPGNMSPLPPGTGSGGGTGNTLNSDAWKSQTTPNGCYDACVQMVGYTPDPKNRIITSGFNKDGQLSPQSGATKGIQTIDTYLAGGKPIVVGVNWNGGTQPLNEGHEQTQHYVVVVGSGTDSGGKYYNFYDPGTSHASKGTSPDNKLYVNGDSLSGKSVYNQSTKTYTVTEVRPR